MLYHITYRRPTWYLATSTFGLYKKTFIHRMKNNLKMRILFKLNCKFLLTFETAKFKMNGSKWMVQKFKQSIFSLDGPDDRQLWHMFVYFDLWPSIWLKYLPLPVSAGPFGLRILNFHPCRSSNLNLLQEMGQISKGQIWTWWSLVKPANRKFKRLHGSPLRWLLRSLDR